MENLQRFLLFKIIVEKPFLSETGDVQGRLAGVFPQVDGAAAVDEKTRGLPQPVLTHRATLPKEKVQRRHPSLNTKFT